MRIFLLIAFGSFVANTVIAQDTPHKEQRAVFVKGQGQEKKEDDPEYYKSDKFRLEIAVLAAYGLKNPNILLEYLEKKSPEIAKIANELRQELKTSKFFEDMAKKTDDQEQKEMLMKKAESLKEKLEEGAEEKEFIDTAPVSQETSEGIGESDWGLRTMPVKLNLLGTSLILATKAIQLLSQQPFSRWVAGQTIGAAHLTSTLAINTGVAFLGYGTVSALYNTIKGMAASQDQKKKYQENRTKAVQLMKYGYSGALWGVFTGLISMFAASSVNEGCSVARGAARGPESIE